MRNKFFNYFFIIFCLNLIFITKIFANIYQVDCNNKNKDSINKISFNFSYLKNEATIYKINNFEKKYDFIIQLDSSKDNFFFKTKNEYFDLIYNDTFLNLKVIKKDLNLKLPNTNIDNFFFTCETILKKRETFKDDIFKNIKEEKLRNNKEIIFESIVYANCNIINENDKTYFKNIKLLEKDKVIYGKDRRVSLSKNVEFNAHIYEVEYKDNKILNIIVNSEFGQDAKNQALKYGKMLGRLPSFYYTNLRSLSIHKGEANWSANTTSMSVHTNYLWGFMECEEEVMMHEGGHSSLDHLIRRDPIKQESYINKNKWIKAQLLDKSFISKYAYDKLSEDLAETAVWWVAIRCKKNRLKDANFKKVIEGIPNKIKYLDSLKLKTKPLKCN